MRWILFPPSGKKAALSQSTTPATSSKFGCNTRFERSQSICDSTGKLKGLIMWMRGMSSSLYDRRNSFVDLKGPRWGSWLWIIPPRHLAIERYQNHWRSSRARWYNPELAAWSLPVGGRRYCPKQDLRISLCFIFAQKHWNCIHWF